MAFCEFFDYTFDKQSFTDFLEIEVYIVSGHRFNILEDVGCYPAIINTWLAYLLVGTWPIVIGLISAVYCGKLHVLYLLKFNLIPFNSSESSGVL